ncbi:glycyl radical protein [Vallitalea guaymasensis]|uniref:Pyruvate formate-lyase n=1 Tax=Vallitalea guaymasensis TaxID=1185412 RepID=A0A8J8M7P7_9FIRM|nr:pyruvate formate lyase family protein [Vallitalea guaymasensis]QUH27904.1 pyruvate formate-lyase [Vallitalea guaymasensis]
MNDRITKLRKRLFETQPKICSERCVIFTESMKQSEGLPIAIRRAEGFYEVLDKMSIVISDDEIIVGNQAKCPKSSPIYPEYSYEWLIEEFDGNPYYFDERPGDKFYYDEKTKQEILACIDYWKGKSLYENFRKTLSTEINEAWDAGIIDDTWVSAAGLGNVIVDYNLVLKKGLKDVITRIEKRISELDLKEPGNVKKKWFLEGALKGNQAVVNFSNRIAYQCEIKANEIEDENRKKELLDLANICRNVPLNPAKTFHEAVQSIYLILLAVHLESNGHAISLGRFDQYVYPFYRNDIEKGILTREQGLEIIEAFFIKCNELNKLRSWPDSEFFLGYQMFINLAIGGQTVDGKDAVNDVSYLCIEACQDVKLFTPSISVKWFDKTSDEFMLKALEAVMVHQGGQPAFYNDKAFMRTLENMGIAKEDLVDWSPDGCIEASIPGKWDFAAKGPWLNVEKILEITLNNGVDPKTGMLFKKTTKDIRKCESTEEIFNEYKQLLKFFMDLQVITEHINDEIHVLNDINAFRASLVEDCIGRGLDLVEGGSLYSADGGPTAGTISAGNALAAIDTVVFDKKIITIEQLLYALETNFEDNDTTPKGEEIRLILKNKAPKFGNDNDIVDGWVVKLEDFIGSSYRHDYKSSKYGKGPIPCCYSYSQSPVTGNIAFGRCIGATPDGRKSGEPVNNGISPANGTEKNGATATCNSIAKLPSIWFQKGAIFNMRLIKPALATKENRKRIIDMVKVLFNNYGQQIQFNVVDGEIYKEAMKNPQNYNDLMVRVSGYSALFTTLVPEVQLDVINRTELEI